MRKLAVFSGKAGGLQAMIPMLRLFRQSGRWEVTVYLLDQHQESTPELPEGVHSERFTTDRSSSRLYGLFGAFHTLSDIRADLIIVYGDRADALLGATLGHELAIPVAHLQAGDLSGGIDNANRYAISLLSTWQFCSTETGQTRLRVIGGATREDLQSYVVGDHHIDAVLEAASGKVRIPPPGDCLVVHLHSDTLRGPDYNYTMARRVCEGTEGWPRLFLAPCTDLHRSSILEGYRDAGVSVQPPLPLEEYVSQLLECRALIGNTSAVGLDAPVLGVPSVLVGYRQQNRAFVPERVHTAEQIRRAIMTVPFMTDPRPVCEALGNGQAGRRTFEVLDGMFFS